MPSQGGVDAAAELYIRLALRDQRGACDIVHMHGGGFRGIAVSPGKLPACYWVLHGTAYSQAAPARYIASGVNLLQFRVLEGIDTLCQ